VQGVRWIDLLAPGPSVTALALRASATDCGLYGWLGSVHLRYLNVLKMWALPYLPC